MKIITGEYGGRRFDPPRNLQARPTTDLAKQALFNILQCRFDIEGCRALDLFSGTGSISFELLSRGASHVTSVEMGRQQQQFIQHVAEQLRVPRDRHQLVRGDVFRFLSGHPVAGPLDFIFADPPYRDGLYGEIISLCLPLLKADGVLILEHASEDPLPEADETRAYGSRSLSFIGGKL